MQDWIRFQMNELRELNFLSDTVESQTEMETSCL